MGSRDARRIPGAFVVTASDTTLIAPIENSMARSAPARRNKPFVSNGGGSGVHPKATSRVLLSEMAKALAEKMEFVSPYEEQCLLQAPLTPQQNQRDYFRGVDEDQRYAREPRCSCLRMCYLWAVTTRGVSHLAELASTEKAWSTPRSGAPEKPYRALPH